MTKRKAADGFTVDDIKRAAQGHWPDIIRSLTGVSADLLDGKNHGCPKCGEGKDRFKAFRDFPSRGGLFCNQCHNGSTNPKSGDGIAAVQWLTGWTFAETLRAIAEHLGIAPTDSTQEDRRDILGDLCKQKKMPLESAIAYGATIAKRGFIRVVRFPIYDAAGQPTSYTDMSPYATGKLNKGLLPKGGTAGLHLPNGRLPQPGETWLISEGVKDAAALHSLGYNAAGLTGCTLKSEFALMFSGCIVVLVPDLDFASLRGFAKIGSELEATAESVLVAKLPGEVRPSKGEDVRDIIARDGIEVVHKAIDHAEVFDKVSLLGGRATVYVTLADDVEIEVANKVIRILAARGFATNDADNRIYQRGGKLVAVANTDTGPLIYRIDEIGIRERITAAMDLIESYIDKEGLKTERPVRPPSWLCRAIDARASYDHFRRLDGIVTAPTIRPDGSILQTAGYDPESRLLYIPDGVYPAIPNKPTIDDAGRAVADLLDLVQDFPFADEASKSVWLALVLTLLCRAAIPGCVPLFSFSANIRGSGKSKLCDLAALIAFGRRLARKTLPRDDEETRKVITAIAIEAKSAVMLDNAAGMIGNESLDAILTSETWSDRILSKSEMTGDLPWRTVLIATGNNLSFKADTARRVILCQLDCREETPEDRDDFRHKDVEAHTLDNRHRLVVAALTIMRAFVVAGRPYHGKRLGSFESWSDLICGAVEWTGLPNPLQTVSIVRDQDNSGAIVRMLLDGIEMVGGVDGVTSQEIFVGIENSPPGDNQGWDSLRAAFAEITEKPTTRKIGNELKKYIGRVSGGRRLIHKPGRSNLKRWAVEVLMTATEVDGASTSFDEFGDVGNCDQCGEPLTASPTTDGYLNRHCGRCDKPFSCVPISPDSDRFQSNPR
ncbi:MAG: primase-helicase zinc-binding domain-containing protein [Pirellulaceae bacterium]|nr:primase-helicase zinc-binding domain-containing protein [Pirellulaceae bacterium]